MKTKRSNLKSAVLLTTAVVGGTAFSFGAENLNTNELLEYSSLGSGAELRTELLDINRISSRAIERMNSETTIKFSELKCGEGKCGEGKCGEDKKADKKEDKKEAKKEGTKAEDSKAGESKCGENTCGGSDESSEKETEE